MNLEICILMKEWQTLQNSLLSVPPPCRRSAMAWGGPPLKGRQGLNLENICDEHKNKSILLSVVTRVCILEPSVMSNGE